MSGVWQLHKGLREHRRESCCGTTADVPFRRTTRRGPKLPFFKPSQLLRPSAAPRAKARPKEPLSLSLVRGVALLQARARLKADTPREVSRPNSTLVLGAARERPSASSDHLVVQRYESIVETTKSLLKTNVVQAGASSASVWSSRVRSKSLRPSMLADEPPAPCDRKPNAYQRRTGIWTTQRQRQHRKKGSKPIGPVPPRQA